MNKTLIKADIGNSLRDSNDLARNLHDRLGPSIASIRLRIDRIVEQTEHKDESIETLANEIHDVQQEFRSILDSLRNNENSNYQVISVINEAFESIRNQMNPKLNYESDYSLTTKVETEIALIAKQAINNIEMHSNATNVNATWKCDNKSAVLEISDDGTGFMPNQSSTNSYGIIGMHERASLIGAELKITSNSNQGTVLKCILET